MESGSLFGFVETVSVKGGDAHCSLQQDKLKKLITPQSVIKLVSGCLRNLDLYGGFQFNAGAA